MGPNLSVLVDHVESGISELRRQITQRGPLTPGERVEAARGIATAAVAVRKIRRVLAESEARQGQELGRSADERGSHANA
jgi:hypothetical protein